MQVIQARTAAPRATRWLERSGRGRVQSKFPSVLNLTNEVGDLLSLVVPVVGNGPFSAVLDLERIPEEIEVTSQLDLEDRAVTVGEFRFDLSSAQVWGPVPAWESLRLLEKSELIQKVEDCLSASPIEEGMAGVYYSDVEDGPSKFQIALKKGGTLLYEGLASRSVEMIITAADKLGGLGVGLTPSGDDFLMGVMYGLRASRPAEDAKATSDLIYAGAAGKTNTLSRAWLAAAVDGEAVESWHELIKAVTSNRGQDIHQAVQAILSIGETSGADALTGFVQLLKLEQDR